MRCNQKNWVINLSFTIFILLVFLFANNAKAETGVCLLQNDDGSQTCKVAGSQTDCAVKATFTIGWVSCETFYQEMPEAKTGAKGGLSALKKSVNTLTAGKVNKPLEEVIGGYIKTALVLVGTLFMALTFYGGYIWFIAREDEEEAKRARSIISMALIGLIIVLSAYFVTYFIIYRLTVASGTGLLK